MPPPPPSVALAEHLQFIASLPAEYITEFGKAALALLQQQAQGKMFANVLCGLHTWHGSAHAQTCAPSCLSSRSHGQGGSGHRLSMQAAKQLGVEREAVEEGVQALCYVLLRAASHGTPAEQLLDGVELELQPDALAALHAFYEEAAPSLAQIQSRGPALPSYHSLEWRLQVQIAGRHAVAGEVQPSYLLRLHTEDARGFGAPQAEHLLQASARRPPAAVLRPMDSTPRPRPAAMYLTRTRVAGRLCQPAPPHERAGRGAARGDLAAFAPHRAARREHQTAGCTMTQ